MKKSSINRSKKYSN